MKYSWKIGNARRERKDHKRDDHEWQQLIAHFIGSENIPFKQRIHHKTEKEREKLTASAKTSIFMSLENSHGSY